MQQLEVCGRRPSLGRKQDPILTKEEGKGGRKEEKKTTETKHTYVCKIN